MMTSNNRLDWRRYALGIAEVAALRSEDVVKVGACALDHENRVIGVAYNGLAPGKTVSEDFWVDRDNRRKYMIHAETNLLSLFSRGQCKTIACTLSPCSACAAMIAGYGIQEVVYKEKYEKDLNAIEIFKFYGISCNQIEKSVKDLL